MKRAVYATALVLTTMMSPATAEDAMIKPIDATFVRADENGDFVIDKVEFLQVALRHFSTADFDDDDYIEVHEMGDQAKADEFLDGDTDKDGKLSVEEVMAEKLADFTSADLNKDGVLSVGEVRKAYGG